MSDTPKTKIEYKNNWPMDSTRFLLPTIAFRGFRKGTRIVTLAVWTWRINFILPNAQVEARRK
jgi:hypothetical protein